jgi:hypothetical protein
VDLQVVGAMDRLPSPVRRLGNRRAISFWTHADKEPLRLQLKPAEAAKSICHRVYTHRDRIYRIDFLKDLL